MLSEIPNSLSSVSIRTDNGEEDSQAGDRTKEKLKRKGSKVWDTTNKVLGVHTVLGTAGLTGSLVSAPALGGGIIGEKQVWPVKYMYTVVFGITSPSHSCSFGDNMSFVQTTVFFCEGYLLLIPFFHTN